MASISMVQSKFLQFGKELNAANKGLIPYHVTILDW